ncbi:CbiQ family ECF transporter T component [Crocosphaera sp.]|uniref:energy-coupling factor transporter transmembrane component T family protein n=1 Tax=Crocosphaera sp. TaxID=2729996 RepID=UPI002630A24D|nr:CbiQ family ECF transporter T component [Crocosphaera sp.]MDJ0579583.1 CbiQ family ECF transporter T component [Crocosphaera sp.]
MDLLRSLPIGLYLENPFTWLHKLDPRVKLAWLLSFLLAPILSTPEWRLVLVGLLMILTLIAQIPLRVWKQQMGWLLILSFLILILTTLSPDGLAVSSQPRLPESDLSLPQPTNYSYVLIDEGRLFITRRSLELGIRISTLIFILIYSTNLYLLTTAPEEITAGLDNLLSPLRRFKIPITEILLTLTLSLRFIALVLEEVQNLIRSIRTRAINWKKLGIKKSLQVWLVVVEKLFENLLMRAEEIAIAMEVRGFLTPNQHQVDWHQLRLIGEDWLALGLLIIFWYGRLMWGNM